MKLVVGLGNPGPKYERTRHNIGFLAADEIIRRHGFRSPREKFNGHLAEGEIGAERVLVLKPMTYMNESGQSVGPAMRFHKLTPADIVVLHDELDLPPGKLRTKRGGGTGGHNGLRSIDAHIGQDYWRVRLGVGHPGTRELVMPYLTQMNFAADDMAWLEKLIPAVADALPLMLNGQDSAFMSKVGLLMDPPPAKPARAVERGSSD